MTYKEKFIKEYVDLNPPLALQDAKDTLENLIEVLPARERNTKKIQSYFDMVKEQVNEAFDDIIKTIASCPFVHIVINNDEELFTFMADLRAKDKVLSTNFSLIAGYCCAENDKLKDKMRGENGRENI